VVDLCETTIVVYHKNKEKKRIENVAKLRIDNNTITYSTILGEKARIAGVRVEEIDFIGHKVLVKTA